MTSAAVMLAFVCAVPLHAQLIPFRTGANRPDVSWQQIETPHFRVVYHTGLDSVARRAADVAEAVYPVVTGNLGTPIPGRTSLYLSDLDEVPNAFAMGDRYIYVWMRGIMDDMPPVGIRSSGHSKWLRSAITHEFTHIVLEHATKSWLDLILPVPSVPRWMHEGLARTMEPDVWTPDLDMALRVAAVNDRLDYDLASPGVLDGTLLYETGHSLVRYFIWRFGDTIWAKILHSGRGLFGWDFNRAVIEATGRSFSDVADDWKRAVMALYGAEYAPREEPVDAGPIAISGFGTVLGARFASDRKRAAVLASRGPTAPYRLYLIENPVDSATRSGPEELYDEGGIDPEFSFDPSGRRLAVSKQRIGSHRALVRDLYVLDIDSRDLRRLTSDAMLSDPSWSPDGTSIVAVEKRAGRDNLVLVEPESGAMRPLSRFDGDVQIYTPSWSPAGDRVAFSLFDTLGRRSIAIVHADGTGLTTLTTDTSNNRYPVFSPGGDSIAFTSNRGGYANVYVMRADGIGAVPITATAAGMHVEQWVPGTDSVMALAFDTRDKLEAHFVAAGRRTEVPAAPVVREKFRAWRSAQFQLRPPAADSIPVLAVATPDQYSPIGALYPLIPLLPIVNAGRPRDGGEQYVRWGATTVWTDPLGHHSAIAYADFGKDLSETGGEILYMNNSFAFGVTVHGDYSLGYRRTIDGIPYHERHRGVELRIDVDLPDANSLESGSRLQLGGRLMSQEPWNLPELAAAGVASSDLPIAARLSEVEAAYAFGARNLLASVLYKYASPALGSDLEYHRVQGYGSARYSIWQAVGVAVIGRVDAVAHLGDQVPQDRLRLAEDDWTRGEWVNLTELLAPRADWRVRGFHTAVPGDRLVIASAGIQTGVPILPSLFPLIGLFQPQLVVFGETGSAWFSDSTAIGQTQWRTSYGGELRSELLPHTWLSVGLARGLGERSEGWDLYVRWTRGL